MDELSTSVCTLMDHNSVFQQAYDCFQLCYTRHYWINKSTLTKKKKNEFFLFGKSFSLES